MHHRLWPTFLLFISISAFAVNTPLQHLPPVSIERRESQLSRTVARASHFIDVAHVSSVPSCQEVQAPEELTTPDPLFATAAQGQKVTVSFIIGIDGHVHSPLILESAGMARDRRVLQTVRTWKYRPATCNGVPTEIEGKVEFSTQ